MAIHFTETEKKSSEIQELLSKETEVAEKIANFNSEDSNAILKLRDELAKSWKNFTGEERKLNVAVVGRVKAGKSTFLNTVIFGGLHVLPEAFTPKTATLTKIEYAEKNSLEIEYYSLQDWQEIEENANTSGNDDNITAAKELVESAQASGIDVNSILSKGTEIINFESEDELTGRLNDYVGASGKITPLVKCVTLKITKEQLQGISIVDTPGLNDPVMSRTQKTKDFLADCDVIFFLSPADPFLDKSDIDLLKIQLPQKCVARIILVCSKFDGGISDEIYNFDSLEEAIKKVKSKLQSRAAEIFNKQVKNYEQHENFTVAELLKECRQPIFLSSVFHNMIGKNEKDFDEMERQAFKNINYYNDLSPDMIKIIGDIEPVNNRLQEIISQKDFTLSKKANQFVPLARKNLHESIENFKTVANHKLNQLVTGDKVELERQQREVNSKINNVKSRLEEYFGDINAKIEHTKIDIVKDLRQSVRDYETLATRTGTDYHTSHYTVSDSKWYKPSTWGQSHKVFYSYETHYTYVDANESLDYIRNYAREAASSIDSGFEESADLSNLKRRILTLVVDSFDQSDETYDPAYFRLMTEKTLNKFELPVMNIDVMESLNSISSKFSGEIRDSSARSQLQKIHSETMSKIFNDICDKFTSEIVNFKQNLETIKNTFAEQLLTDINKEFEELKAAYKDKEVNIQKLNNYLAALNKL